MSPHLGSVSVDVDGLPALLGELDRQLDREAVRGGEGERVFPADRLSTGQLVEELQAALDRLRETLFLVPHDTLDLRRPVSQLWVGVAHLLDDDPRHAMDILEADPPRLGHRPPDDPPEHVPPSFVGGSDAVAHEEGHAARVVGQDPVRLRRGRRVAIRHPGLGRDPLHDQLVAVGVEHRRHVLDDSCRPLEPEARVDVLLRQRRERSVRVKLVLHEHEVPELEKALAPDAARQALGRAAPGLRPPVVVDLGVRAAGPGATHRPEVLGRRQRHDSLRRHADLFPEVDRHLVWAELQVGVACMDAHPDAVPVEPQPLANELRRQLDRARLEVLPEREVAEHLEERQVVGVEPDLVDVGRPEHLLHRGRQRRRGRLETEEIGHLRLHPCAREQRRAIVGARHERRRGAAQMTLLLEEREESLS